MSLHDRIYYEYWRGLVLHASKLRDEAEELSNRDGDKAEWVLKARDTLDAAVFLERLAVVFPIKEGIFRAMNPKYADPEKFGPVKVAKFGGENPVAKLRREL